MKLWATRDSKKWSSVRVYVWKRKPTPRNGVYSLDGDTQNYLFVLRLVEFESAYGFLPEPGQCIPVHHLNANEYDVEGER